MIRVSVELTAPDGHGVVKALTSLKRMMLADVTERHGHLGVKYGFSGPGACGLTCTVNGREGAINNGPYPAGEEG